MPRSYETPLQKRARRGSKALTRDFPTFPVRFLPRSRKDSESLTGRPPEPTMKSSNLLSEGAVVAILLFAPVSLRAGIPEPDLVWYGKVLTVSGGATVRVTTGTLTWQIEPLAGGTPWTISTPLTNINDQFSFVLRVACETPESGVAGTDATVHFTTPATGYRRITVTLDGQSLSLIGASGEFAPLPTDRGRSENINLQLGNTPVDSDGNGLGDAWEIQYFGRIGADPNADPDGD